MSTIQPFTSLDEAVAVGAMTRAEAAEFREGARILEAGRATMEELSRPPLFRGFTAAPAKLPAQEAR